MDNDLITKALILFLNFLPSIILGQQEQINIIDLGAIADGKTGNTLIIQKAIDDCDTIQVKRDQ